jgi:hypothetical protein
MASNFDRSLDRAFIAKLAAEGEKGGWWADVLADPELLIFPRGSYLKVYWRALLSKTGQTCSGAC